MTSEFPSPGWNDLSPTEQKRFLSYVEQAFPEKWRASYPRVYREPRCGTYYSPKLLAAQLVETANNVENGLQGKVLQYEYLFATRLCSMGIPHFWLGANIAQAIRRTRPNVDIPWLTMKMPVEAGVIMMPKGSLVHPSEGDIAMIGWARLEAGVSYTSTLCKEPTGSDIGGMVITGISTDGGNFFHWSIPADIGPTIRLVDLEEIMLDTPVRSNYWPLGHLPMSREDLTFIAKVAHYIFLTLMVIADRPTLLTPASLEKRVQKKGSAPKEFWSPNIIGDLYRIREEATPPVGEHRPPELHLVRGFFREQPYGPGRTLRRPTWIDPYWRGGE